MFVRGALGDADDDDSVLHAEDARSAYLAWVAAVKAAGGVTTTAPHLTREVLGGPLGLPIGTQPVLAAQYPVQSVFPNAPSMTLSPAFHHQPDDWSNSGDYVYYVAPDAVQDYAGTGLVAPQSVPGEPPPPNPLWYDDLLKYAKYAGIAVVVLVALNAASYVPRPSRRS